MVIIVHHIKNNHLHLPFIWKIRWGRVVSWLSFYMNDWTIYCWCSRHFWYFPLLKSVIDYVFLQGLSWYKWHLNLYLVYWEVSRKVNFSIKWCTKHFYCNRYILLIRININDNYFLMCITFCKISFRNPRLYIQTMFFHIMKGLSWENIQVNIPFFRLYIITSFPFEQPFTKMSWTCVQGSGEFVLGELSYTSILFCKSNVEFVE